VALALRRRADVDVHLTVEIELGEGGLTIAGERKVRIDDAAWPKLFVPESRVLPMPMPILFPCQFPSHSGVDATSRRQPIRAPCRATVAGSQSHRHSRWASGRVVLGLHEVQLTQRHGVEVELVGNDVNDPLEHPQLLHARVATIWRYGHLFVSAEVKST